MDKTDGKIRYEKREIFKQLKRMKKKKKMQMADEQK